MSSRLLAMRSAASALRQPVPRQLVRSSIRRGYASTPVQDLAQSSDLPWLAGSVAVTVTGLYFILPSGRKKTGAHGGPAHKAEEVRGASEPPKGEESSEAPKAEKGETTSQPSSETGQDVPPPPSDNTPLAENTEEKKEQHEQYKDTTMKHDTKVATSSSDLPSKKTAMEHPREDPQRGEGEAKQKGGPTEDEAK